MKKKIVDHFKKVDPILFSIIEQVGRIETLTQRKQVDYFCSLCREIINQQLADKAAHAIFERFCKLFSSKKVTPETLLKIQDGKIRKTGTSWAKVRFLKDLAKKIMNREVNLNQLQKLENRVVVEELTKVKGIGPWTAEMFLMFSLGREDVFSYGDLGLQKAIKKLYRFKKTPTRKQIENITIKWSPYRTYACQILWASHDAK